MTTQTKKFLSEKLNTKNSNIISETRRPDGSLATQIIQIRYETYLIQYDTKGQVVFKEKMEKDIFTASDITYHDGCVASITRHDTLYRKKTVTQYDSNGHVVTSMDLNESDIVNFSPSGYIRSIVKHIHEYGGTYGRVNEIEELQFNDSGYIVSSTHKVKMSYITGSGAEKWMTTEAKQYYPNGRISSHITYKQKTKREGSFISENQEDEAASYISSITQYSENGKIQISVQLGEYDEVSFNNDKVACITRRIKKRDGGLDISSQTTYYPSGNICSIITYKDGKVVSSITYDENGKPLSSAQEGNANYQNIFANSKEQKKTIPTMKAVMTPQHAANILGVSLNASEQEINKAYRKLCKQWHPDRNPGNEDLAKRKMQIINEAHDVLIKYARSRQNRPNQNQNPNTGSGARPTYESPAQKAWKKLQNAIRESEIAKQQYDMATANKNRLLAEYSRTSFSDPKREKISAELKKATAYQYECMNKLATANANLAKCKQEYHLACMMKSANMNQKTYQYAA